VWLTILETLPKEVGMTSQDFLGLVSLLADIFWWLRR
jgi:hypothetical protein